MNDLFVLNDWTENVFCPTGPGGGVDPTCSPSRKKGRKGGNSTGQSIAMTREEAIQRLEEAWSRGEAGDQDPLGQAAAGPPPGHSEMAPRIKMILEEHAKTGFVGKPIHEIYAEVGSSMTKEEFNRSLIEMHKVGEITLTGFTKDLMTVPDPELVPMISSRYMGSAKTR